MIHEIQIACSAFLIAVLVCDLTFDLPALGARADDAGALEAAMRYYATVTARRSPLAMTVAAVMAALLSTFVGDLVSGPASGLPTPALVDVLAALPITLALTRTFPNAKRLASDAVDATARKALARKIAGEHLFALAGMVTYFALLLRRLGMP